MYWKNLLAACCFILTFASALAGEKKPNILIFLVDDMGWQDTSVPFHYVKGKPVVTPLNQFYKTPAMESMAATGVKFTQAYSTPVCSPARTSLMTGKNAAHHRVSTWTALQEPKLNDEIALPQMKAAAWKEAGMSHDEVTLPQVLKAAGYRNILVGKAHFAPNSEPYADPLALGFDVNIAGNGLGGPGSYRSDQNFVKGNPAHQVPGMEKYATKGKNPSEEELKANFLTSALTTEMEAQIEQAVRDHTPFFAYMTHYAVHATHEDPDPNGDKASYFNALPPLQEGTQQDKGQLANYATLIEGMDMSLGRLLAKLNELGIAEETLVIFLSDNGGDAPIQKAYGRGHDFLNKVGAVAPLRGRKGSHFEGGTRIPMLMAWAKPNPKNPIQSRFPIKSGSVNNRIVAIWDMFPTITQLVGQSIEHDIDGHDVAPLLKAPAMSKGDSILQHFPHSHTFGAFYSTLRVGDWKVIYNYYDDYVTKKFPWQLYHLKDDLSESKNLALEPAHRKRLDALARQLLKELKESAAQYPRLVAPGDRNSIIGDAPLRLPHECSEALPMKK